MTTGKTIATRIPVFRLSEAALATAPTSVGPPEHPKSPASASSANIAIPPFRRTDDALLNVPGHMIPTDKPQMPQPTSENTGSGDSTISR